jgi:hypothetical protein
MPLLKKSGLTGMDLLRLALEENWIAQVRSISAPRQWELTREAFRQARQKTLEWIEHLGTFPARHRRSKQLYRRYWQIQNYKAQIPV